MNRRLSLGLFLVWGVFSAAHAAGIRDQLRSSVDVLNSDNCVLPSENISRVLNALSPEDYQKEISKNAHQSLLQELWDFKLTMHGKLRSFHKSGDLPRDCSDALRGAFWSIRMAEDVIHDDYYRKFKDTLSFPDHAYDTDNVHVRKNPKFGDFDLKSELRSGDILLTRGNAYTSAAISNLGEFDTQFSHMSVVYRDPQGELWTVEAHIEVGSFVRPLQEHIDDKNARTMVYRFDDPKVAAKAAEYIFHKVKKASDTTGNILYDFGFDLEENSQLFCSEIASYAYDVASGGEHKLPLFTSSLIKRKVEFVRLLELKPDESFIPADIEVDARFTVVAEWRNAGKMKDILQKDAILQSMFKWHDDYGYRLKQASSKDSLLYRNVAWPLRRVPILKKYFKDKLPINMSRKLIGYFGVLNAVGELLQEKLAAAEEKALSERGTLLSRKEKFELLEAVREEDRVGKKKLHKMYRPKKK